MTKSNVKSFFDERDRVAHRLMMCEIDDHYSYINGDTRCAGTYINDPKGSSQKANVVFEFGNIEEIDELECLIPIKTLRDIEIGEELLVDYGNLFFDEIPSTQPNTQVDSMVFIILIIYQIIESESKIESKTENESNEMKKSSNIIESTKVKKSNIQLSLSKSSSSIKKSESNITDSQSKIDEIKEKTKDEVNLFIFIVLDQNRKKTKVERSKC